MKTITFTTKTKATYVLTHIQPGQERGYSAGLQRIEGDKPMVDISGGTLDASDEALVVFDRLPKIGESFQYWHAQHAGCTSTPVTSIMVTLKEEFYDPI